MAEETAELARQLGQVPENRMEELQALCDLAEGGLRINSSDGVLGVSSVHGGAHVGSF